MNKQTVIALVLSLLALSTLYYKQAQKTDQQFQQWKLKFQPSYDVSEQVYRRFIFEKNLKIIEEHNADPTQTYKMGVNQFTVYTPEQFKLIFLSEMIVPENQIQDLPYQEYERYNPQATEIDWAAKGKVSKVKNQGACGSCWAFAAVATCESWGLINGKTYDLSEQQLVDCTGSYGNKGCNGGWPASALKYVQASGIVNQADYPYVARQQTCQKTGGGFKINQIVNVQSGCSNLQSSILVEPIAVTVDATNWSRYSSGVFSNCATSINHAVLLVGIVSGNWKIKNSWGGSWGQSGYIRLAAGNTCGLCNYSSSYAK